MSQTSTQKPNHSSSPKTSNYGPHKTPRVNNWRGGRDIRSANKQPFCPTFATGPQQGVINLLIEQLQQSQKLISQLEAKLEAKEREADVAKSVRLNYRTEAVRGRNTWTSITSLPVNAKECAEAGSRFRSLDVPTVTPERLESSNSINVSEAGATNVNGTGEPEESEKVVKKRAPHAGIQSVKLTAGTLTDKPLKMRPPRTCVVKKPFVERQVDKVRLQGQKVVRFVNNIGQRTTKSVLGTDEELVGYLRYMFAFTPRNVTTLRSMTHKARIFLNDYDLTSFDYGELHSMVVTAVAEAMKAPEAELDVMKNISKSDIKAMNTLNDFVQEGQLKPATLFGKAKKLTSSHKA